MMMSCRRRIVPSFEMTRGAPRYTRVIFASCWMNIAELQVVTADYNTLYQNTTWESLPIFGLQFRGTRHGNGIGPIFWVTYR